jgi:hypothetical protein
LILPIGAPSGKSVKPQIGRIPLSGPQGRGARARGADFTTGAAG